MNIMSNITTKHTTFTLPVNLIEKLNSIKWLNKSKFAKEAIEEKLKKLETMNAIIWLRKIRKKSWKFSENEITSFVRQDRQSH